MGIQVRFRLNDRQSNPDSLTAFNRLVEECQDDAYTLAYRLLGDEKGAAGAVTEAVRRVHQEPRAWNQRDFKLALLRYVIKACQPVGSGASVDLNRDDIQALLNQLPFNLRAAAVLVDVLGLQYREAAQAMDASVEWVGRQLAAARMQILTAAGESSPDALY